MPCSVAKAACACQERWVQRLRLPVIHSDGAWPGGQSFGVGQDGVLLLCCGSARQTTAAGWGESRARCRASLVVVHGELE
mmetsp:Transcript_72314/g.195549  ORF Transcript_72314/g.195549 Transcript_72314/m.195549 type:complete len:80 (-) Transcript_72314:81-320(-)